MSIYNVIYGSNGAEIGEYPSALAVTEDYVYLDAHSKVYITDKSFNVISYAEPYYYVPDSCIRAQDNQNVFVAGAYAVTHFNYNLSTLSVGRHFPLAGWEVDHIISFDLSDSTHLWIAGGKDSSADKKNVYLIDTTSYVSPDRYSYHFRTLLSGYPRGVECTNNHKCICYDDRIEYYTYGSGMITLRGTIYQTGSYSPKYNQTYGYLYVATGNGVVAIEATGSVESPTLSIVDSVSDSNFEGLATRGDYLVAISGFETNAYIYKIINSKLKLISIFYHPRGFIRNGCDIYGDDIYLITNDWQPIKLELSGNVSGVLNQQLIY